MDVKKKPSIMCFIRNIPFIISGVMCVRLNAAGDFSAATFILILIFIAALFADGLYRYWKEHMSWIVAIISACLLLILSYPFDSGITSNAKIQTIITALSLNVQFVGIIINAAIFAIRFYFVSIILELIYSIGNLNTQEGDKIKPISKEVVGVTKKQAIEIIIIAIVTITLLSESSPIYPLNTWCDSTAFMTVGKSMLHGLIPYRDLFEHKGPLLYMLHALAALVSEVSFLGVYFIEIVACAFFLFFSYKIIRLYEPTASVWVIPIFSAMVYSAIAFQHGDSAEELCLPLLSFALYVGLKSVKNNKAPTWIECLIVGITSACVLWIKFTMLGFYLGWFLAVAYIQIRQHNIKKVFTSLAQIVLGVFITTIPILIYFYINNALADLYTIYFYDNLFMYSDTSDTSFIVSMLRNLFVRGMRNIVNNNLFVGILIYIGAIRLVKNKAKTELASYIEMIAFTFLFVYIGGNGNKYYSLIFSVFAPVGIAAIYNTFLNYDVNFGHFVSLKRDCKYMPFVICMMAIVAACIRCSHLYLIGYSKSDLPQYQFAEIISQTEDATLLNYGSIDGGFYITTGITPNCKYFFKPNIEVPEIMESQNEFVENGKVTYVITLNEELESDLYTYISEANLPNSSSKYYLYQLTSSLE